MYSYANGCNKQYANSPRYANPKDEIGVLNGVLLHVIKYLMTYHLKNIGEYKVY